MEARSLASINYLAGNPPQYPVNPAEQRHDPLTLYLSRVPGTRDIILSPFRPQLKNVTAEDVANSLYYVHHEMPSSHNHTADLNRYDENSRVDDDARSIMTIPRKPVAASIRNPSPERNYLSPDPPLRNRDPSPGRASTRTTPPLQPEDSGVGMYEDYSAPYQPQHQYQYQHQQQQQQYQQKPEIRAPLARKPLGPRPGANSAPPNLHPSPAPSPPAPGLRFDEPPPPAADYAPARKSISIPHSSPPRKAAESPFSSPFTLTLIRRDPGSGNQWNVGRISSFQTEVPLVDQDETGVLHPSARPMSPPSYSLVRPPINISIDTLGYAKFKHMPARKSMDSASNMFSNHLGALGVGVPGGLGGPGGLAGAPITFPEDELVQARGGPFKRQVMMSYSKSWSSTIKEKYKRAEAGGFKLSKAAREHRRNTSAASNESSSSAASAGSDGPAAIGHPGPGMKPRGYVFTSPWDAPCEFRTGQGGRSLRCYHIIHDQRSSSFNPLVAEQQQNDQAPRQGGAIPVSELRFNLPGADLFKSGDGRLDAKTQMQGHFNKLFKVEQPHDDSDPEDGMDNVVSPLDMDLGREKAGGGSRGKRAKLGKLIIYPDGLKMLDLIVAANVGVWWGSWERSFN